MSEAKNIDVNDYLKAKNSNKVQLSFNKGNTVNVVLSTVNKFTGEQEQETAVADITLLSKQLDAIDAQLMELKTQFNSLKGTQKNLNELMSDCQQIVKAEIPTTLE